MALKNASQTIKSRDSLCKILSKNHYDVIRSHTNSIHFHHKTNDNSKIIKIYLKRVTALSMDLPKLELQ